MLILFIQKTSVSRHVQSSGRTTTREEQYTENTYANGGTKVPDEPKRITISLPIGEDITMSDVVTSTSTDDPVIYTGSTSEKLLSEIKNILLTVQKEREDNKNAARNRTEWQLVALVLDRAFLILFVVLTIVVSLTILLNHPSYDAKDWPIK